MNPGSSNMLHNHYRSWFIPIALILATVVISVFFTSCTAISTSTPSPTPVPVKPVPIPGAAETTAANLPPVIFVMLDWMNGDWGNPNYQFSYVDQWGYRHDYVGHPEYGALGGWTAFKWSDLNPQKGVYDWSKTDKYIKDAQNMQVTLPDGSVIAKPVGIAVEVWAMEELSDQVGIMYIPNWVAGECGSVTSCFDPDGSGGCKRFCTLQI